ncbi:MAG: glycosyltransferase family 4 protein [Patescibacteria group bacterium]
MRLSLLTLEYPPQKGGIASYYRGIVDALRSKGYEMEVIHDGLLFRRFWPRWVRGITTLRKHIAAKKPDLLLIGQILPLGAVAWMLRKKATYAVFLHGMDILSAKQSSRKRWIARKILGEAKFIVVNSDFTGKQVTAYGAALAEKTVRVYPCPTARVSPSPETVETLRRKLGLSGKRMFITMGRVVERKGHDRVIRALPKILERIPEAIYIVAGLGSYLDKLTRLATELGVQHAVRFVGGVSDEERAALFDLCDFCIMPSRQNGADVEGFGLVFLEAALSGKPSIGGRSGGIPEAILDEETGLLVDPEDVDTIADASIRLLTDDALRATLGRQARTRAQNEFTWKKQIQPLLKRLV